MLSRVEHEKSFITSGPEFNSEVYHILLWRYFFLCCLFKICYCSCSYQLLMKELFLQLQLSGIDGRIVIAVAVIIY